MLDANIILSSAGSLAVAVLAFIFFIFQAWIYLKGPAFSWSKWGAGLSLATSIYSVAVFIQFNSAANYINHLAELFQYSMFIILVQSVYGFTFTYLEIQPPRFHRWVSGLHAALLVLLWTTKLVISDEFVDRNFLLLDRSYVEPELGVCGPFFILYSAIGAALCLIYWIKPENRKKNGAPEFICGFLLWAGLGLHDALATLGMTTIQFLMEYGFLGFCLSLMSITLKNYKELFEIALHSQKVLEAEKKKLEAQLQRAQKMEAIGTLAGGVAHDLNNILSGIVSYPDIMLMDLPEDSSLIEPLTTIQKSGLRAAAIVQDLLTLARRGISISEVVNLNDVIGEHLIRPEFEKINHFHPGLEIETALDSKLLNISGSLAHLSKTVMNLVSNAAEAMPDGGRISISTHNQYIDKPIDGYDEIEEGDYAVLTISDSGIGISAEDKECIFEPFYTKKVMGRSGTGLGMAVVWGTVKDHGGYIDLKSAEGQGTTFTLYFPITRESLQDESSPSDGLKNDGQGESILIVDDVEEQRNIASLMLFKLGYAVFAVPSGEAAIEYMQKNSADLIVLDMIMDPGIDGLQTYKKIIESKPDQKAIIASGFSETGRVREAQRLGAGAYVKKPYTIDKIGEAVAAELSR